MKKIIPIVFLFSCSHKETKKEFKHESVEIQDTLMASFHDEIKSIKHGLNKQDSIKKAKQNLLTKEIKKLHHKNKNLQYENEFYMDAINAYTETIDSIR